LNENKSTNTIGKYIRHNTAYKYIWHVMHTYYSCQPKNMNFHIVIKGQSCSHSFQINIYIYEMQIEAQVPYISIWDTKCKETMNTYWVEMMCSFGIAAKSQTWVDAGPPNNDNFGLTTGHEQAGGRIQIKLVDPPSSNWLHHGLGHLHWKRKNMQIKGQDTTYPKQMK
jgi:hypothetical protein